MFHLYRPSPEAIRRFIGRSLELPLSYGPIGLVHNETVGSDVDEVVVAIGRGQVDFDRAKAALRAWKQFDIGWVQVFPPAASLDPGTVVAVLVRHCGFWSLNGCRVVYRLGDGRERFGFAYGTLMNHAESGEELFEVFLSPDSCEVMYRIRAVSRPRAALARIGYPFARFLQARFRRDSAQAMRRVMGAFTSREK